MTREPVDMSTPNVARMYDYFLRGKDHLHVDRVAAQEVLRRLPNARLILRANRQFLIQTVADLTKRGFRQFVDIGSGLPTQENVHQIVRRTDPDARVVYVDNDPVVLCHGRALLETDPNTKILEGDLRQPWQILRAAEAWGGIDWTEPVAVLLLAILHFIPDEDDPHGIVAAIRDVMAPGSALTLTHAELTPDVENAARVYDAASSSATPRTEDAIVQFFGDFDLAAPGLRRLDAVDPDSGPNIVLPWLAGLAYKKGPAMDEAVAAQPRVRRCLSPGYQAARPPSIR